MEQGVSPSKTWHSRQREQYVQMLRGGKEVVLVDVTEGLQG